MGVTAETVASRWGISRTDQDAFALESHRRAAAAIAAGYFRDEIVPVEIPSRKGTVTFQQDEHVRPDTTMEGLQKLARPSGWRAEPSRRRVRLDLPGSRYKIGCFSVLSRSLGDGIQQPIKLWGFSSYT